MKKIAIIGASGHWSYAIDGLKEYADAKLAGFAPGTSEEKNQVLSTFDSYISKGVPFYDDYTMLLEDIKPDVAVINPYYYLNGPITIECLKRGIHCFTEKPLTFYRDELKLIKKLVDEKNLRLSTMLEYRYHPAFYAAYCAVTEGRIGTPIHITAQKSYKSGKKPEWMHTRKKFGGLISWVGSHALDWINWMTENGVEHIKAMETVVDNHGNGEMESSGIVLMRLKNGGQASVNIDYLRPSGAETHGDDRLRIAGKNGIIEVMKDHVKIIDGKYNEEPLAVEEKLQMFAEFLKYIDYENHPYRQSLTDVYALTELCIEAQEAADSEQ